MWFLMFVLFFILFFGRRFELRIVFGFFVGFVGVLVIVIKGEFMFLIFFDLLGVVFGFGSVVIWVFYWFLNFCDERFFVEKMFWNFFFGFVYVLMLVLVSGEF